jgi:hypothetical protein
MKVVVIMIMIAISLLFIYMAFLLCLDPLMNQSNKSTTTTTTTTNANRQPKYYQRQINDDIQIDNPTQECVFSEPVVGGLQYSRQRSSAVLNLVTHEQSKWRKQVRNTKIYSFENFIFSIFKVHQQRQSVYNKHELLN